MEVLPATLEESLFWEIFYGGMVKRSSLAELFEASSATISRATRALLDRGLIVEVSAKSSIAGRHPKLLQLSPKLAYVGGVELDRDRITTAVTDLTGKLLGRSALPASAQNPLQNTLLDCKRALEIALEDAGLRMTQLARVGIGHTGVLDVNGGLCLEWEGMAHWRHIPLRRLFEETFELAVSLGDRATAVALAQHISWPDHARRRLAIYVQIGTGIGAGIFVNGRMLQGVNQAGGEIGHMVIDPNGPLCACGKRGCVESFASSGATKARVREAMRNGAPTLLRAMGGSGSHLTMEMIVSAARQGDELARAALTEAGRALGMGIANAVQLLNPSLVVLAGKFANLAKDLLLDVIKKTIFEQCFQTTFRGLEIRIAPFRKDLGAVGCALLAAVDVGNQLIKTEFQQQIDNTNEPSRELSLLSRQLYR